MSLCQERMTRFYLQPKEDPHGSLIALFVSNLPISLSQWQYRKILLDIIGEGEFSLLSNVLCAVCFSQVPLPAAGVATTTFEGPD